jgi:hypothetical protein
MILLQYTACAIHWKVCVNPGSSAVTVPLSSQNLTKITSRPPLWRGAGRFNPTLQVRCLILLDKGDRLVAPL